MKMEEIKKLEEKLDDVSKMELARFRRVITAANGSNVDQSENMGQSNGSYQVNLYDPHHRITIINTFEFRNKTGYDLAMEHLRALGVRDDLDGGL